MFCDCSSTNVLSLATIHRYAYHFSPVSASALKAPIGLATPKVFFTTYITAYYRLTNPPAAQSQALSTAEVHQSIRDFVRCAELAKEAGYDGVEVQSIA